LVLFGVAATPAKAAPFFSPSAAMTTARYFPAASPLPDGRILIAGGFDGSSVLNSTEIYNPATNSFAPGPSMSTGRAGSAAAPLPDGRILIAGGEDGSAYLNSTEIYNPATNSFAAGPSMTSARSVPAAAALPDGRILIAGGSNGPASRLSSTDIYSPTGNSFTAGPAMSTVRFAAVAAPLPDGRIMIAGGETDTSFLASTEIYNPGTNNFTPGPTMPSGRSRLAAAPLPDGRILMAGGENGYLAWTEIYNPATNNFTPGPSMSTGRTGLAAAPLPDGRILVVGGIDGFSVVNSTEVYNTAPTVRSSGGQFVWQPIGTTSAVRQVGVTNLGSQVMRIGGDARLTGTDASDFEIKSDGCAGRMLRFGQSCWVGLSFSPGDFGPREATLEIDANTSPVTNSIELSGQGVAPEIGPSGATGATGPTGSAGTTGPSGPSGTSGPSGVTGPTGPKGPRGPTGPRGEVIPPGKPVVTQTVKNRRLSQGRSFVVARIRCPGACRVNRAEARIRAGVGRSAKFEVRAPKRLPGGGSVVARLSVPAGIATRLQASNLRSRIGVTIVVTGEGGRTNKSMAVIVRAN
jgi:hypothetical protein